MLAAPLHCNSDSRTGHGSVHMQDKLQFADTCPCKHVLALFPQQQKRCLSSQSWQGLTCPHETTAASPLIPVSWEDQALPDCTWNCCNLDPSMIWKDKNCTAWEVLELCSWWEFQNYLFRIGARMEKYCLKLIILRSYK